MSQRKLYQEIDKLLKKVKDGLQDFDQVYDNFQDSEPSQQSYREKLEGDLKNAIKKLQKQREQIKTWMSKEDVKDREKVLLENRRLIENGMERFKSVEKLMKLKQFSTQALSNPNIVLNPKEIKKLETGDFIEESIDELRKQLETLESNDDIEKIERHNFHIANLENILRLINSDDLECESVDEFKDDILYYVENNLEDPDFVEYDTLYEDMGCEVQFNNNSNNANNTSIITDSAITSTTNDESFIESTPTKKESSASIKQTNSSIPLSASSSPTKSKKNASLKSEISTQRSSSTTPIPAPELDINEDSNKAVNAKLQTLTLDSSPKVNNVEAEQSKKEAKEAQTETVTPNSNDTTQALSDNDPVKQISKQREETLEKLDSLIAQDLEKQAFHNPLFSNGLKDWLLTKKNIIEPSNDELDKDIIEQLESSLLNCPDSIDSEVPKLHEFQLSQTHPTSIYFPQEPILFTYLQNNHMSEYTTATSTLPPNIEKLKNNWNKGDIYSRTSVAQICTKFDLDTLFFIFYHYQGSYDQFIVSRELTLRGWKFNKVDRYWYHQQKEISSPVPGVNKDNVLDDNVQEQDGHDTIESWRYFDYKSSWITRRVGAEFVYKEEDFEKL